MGILTTIIRWQNKKAEDKENKGIFEQHNFSTISLRKKKGRYIWILKLLI